MDQSTWYFLLFLLTLAVCYDWRDYRIPNWLIYAGYGGGFLYRSLSEGSKGSFYWFLDIVFPVIVFYLFFYLKMFGAGDIKLFSVICGVIGLNSAISVITVSLFFGALLSIIGILRYRNLRNRLQYLAAYFSNIMTTRKLLPYVRQIRKEETGYRNQMSRSEHIRQGHIHYSAAILCAMLYCRWQVWFV